MIKEKPELVKAFVQASAKGWEYYKTNYDEINPILNKLNSFNSLEVLKATAENEMKYIYTREALTGGIGMMTEARWSALGKQLVDIGMIPNMDEVKKVFTTEFLPK
jgi:NitT/TauT family transport system substrate-binding protein